MLIDIQTASPPFKVTQKKAAEELKKRMSGGPAIGRLIDMASVHSGIETRSIVLPDAEENETKKFFTKEGQYIIPGTKDRMNEYERWSKLLAKDALEKIIFANQIDPHRINRLITISCTGFFAPGLDYHLMNEFNLSLNIKRTNIGFMGCSAAIIGINNVLENINSGLDEDKYTLMLAVELCSLHLQTEATRDNILANMIFADGCAAALFSKSTNNGLKPKLKILKTFSVMFENSSDYMGWKIGNNGFEMILSSELPKIILEQAAPQIKSLLINENIPIDSINHWALHPGGRAILDSLQKGLNIKDEQMEPSRKVLRNYGNMSSASILFVLKELLNSNKIQKDDYCCAVAFGPGLSMEVALFTGN